MLNAEDEKVLKVLTPETSRVYECLLKHSSAGMPLDKLASELKLTKPTVLHHCDRLMSANLVGKDVAGNYVVTEVVRVSVVRGLKSQFERALTVWLPLLFILFSLSIVAVFTIQSVWVLAVFISLCAGGGVLAVRELKKAW